jgi:hypothetical protein
VKSLFNTYLQDGVSPNDISIFDQSRNFRYNAPVAFGFTDSSQANQRFSMSYVTGSHHFKTGIFLLEGFQESLSLHDPAEMSYTFSGSLLAPISLTQYIDTHTKQVLRPEFGLYAQDQWTIQRVTLNYGLRLDMVHSLVPANHQPASRFVGARQFNKVDCVPCWKDLSPRFAASYDLFGNGKTAVKGSISRFVLAHTLSIAAVADPVSATVPSVSRTWHDTNGNFVPDCDLANPQANGECDVLLNPNFGKTNITTRFDPQLVNGWQNRPYNWQLSGTIEHELRPGIAVNAGYFRTWYGNFQVTDNLNVSPSDYDPYCITAPSNPQLPGGGNQICGLYDIKPSALALGPNNLVTFASKYGRQTHIYNGVDAGFNARLPRSALLGGGISIGNNVSTAAYGGTSSTSRCFVVDSPQELRFCDLPIPHQLNLKLFGSYPLPGDIQASATFQSVPGIPYTATYNAPAADISPSLGRAPAGNVRTVPIELIQNYTQFESRLSQLDLRFTKGFRVKRAKIQGIFDIYNVLNSNTILNENLTYGSFAGPGNWRVPTLILDARMVKFGARLEF